MSQPPAPPLSDLVVVMAHDLKNPLAALMTNLHFLQGCVTGPDQDAVEALGDSATLCEVLERFLRNLDLLGRKDNLVARRQPVSIGALAHEAVTRAQSQASTVGIELLLDVVDGASDASITVDRDLFTRALDNMIANALESAPSGSQVRVAVTRDEDAASIVISDLRSSVPPLEARDSGLTPTVSLDGRRIQGLYGRGLALLCADLAARATGARLEIDGSDGACRLRLVAPVRE